MECVEHSCEWTRWTKKCGKGSGKKERTKQRLYCSSDERSDGDYRRENRLKWRERRRNGSEENGGKGDSRVEVWAKERGKK